MEVVKSSSRHALPGRGEVVRCPFPTLTSAFYHHVTSHPNNVAVRDLSENSRDLSYLQLAAQVQALATKLREHGVRPGQRVPLIVKRGLEMVVGIWAVLSCGAQYVPLDGGVVPDSTIRHVVEQSGGGIALCIASTEARLQNLLPQIKTVLINEAEPAQDVKKPHEYIDLAEADNGCYVIYTSGTTGKPKGVDVTHKNVANLVCLSPGNLGIRPGDCVGQVLNISFDMAAWEIFSCLCNGGTLVVRGSKWEPALQQIDVLICTPTILSKYHPSQLPRIKVVATAGEPSSQGLADLWAAHGTYWNCCGPTETTIVNTMSKHIVGQKLSIGMPTPNNNVYILDDCGHLLGPGSPGVMWAGGDGITRGYIGLPAKTNEVYAPDRFANNGLNMYNTGDLGQWRRDGNIDILGRADDQVKVKGFRVELDGIAATLASAPGVARAAALLIEGEIHGFTSPESQDTAEVLRHVKGRQPYYAVPSHLHTIDQLPSTANGKIDKKALKALATTWIENEKQLIEAAKRSEDTKVEVRSLSSASTETMNEKLDLSHDIPEKDLPRPIRGLRYRIFIVYRRLLSLVWLINVAALIAVIATHANTEWLGYLTAANLVTAVLIRQDMVINMLYTIFCSVPKWAPLCIRSRCADIFHLGGVHSGAGICATAWLLISTVQSTIQETTKTEHNNHELAVLGLSWLLCFLCCILVGFAWPGFRKRYHNYFERIHRFVGWTTLAVFWIRTVLSIDVARERTQELAAALVRNPVFWLLIVATCSIASSWFFLRKVRVNAEVLSDHAVRLHFDYTQPVNGSFTRLSRKPLTEWHSFATIPAPEHSEKGYSLVVSNAGDWTRQCINNPPTELWVRGVPTCGVMRIATLFNRVVVIATGSGIGPLLGHISRPSCPTQLIWSTPRPEVTFGSEIMQTIRRNIPDAVIHDTKVLGRPDLVRMGYNLAQSFGAEAVIVIANEKITKKIVYGLQTRGVPAYGAIWDS